MNKVQLTLQDIFDLPGAVIYNPDNFRNITAVSIDSRNIKKNALFIAIKGERYDGHDFVNLAIKNGARSVIIDKKYLNKIKDTYYTIITVPDTIKALGDLARIWRLKLKAKVIGITGSSGKTTTKEILATLLSEKYKVNKTIENNNNHIGVPLTILSTNSTHEVLVAECGTNHFGEIPYTADILLPDIALITNIGDSHLEYLKNRMGVFKEKSALFEAAAKRKGKILVNNDDILLRKYTRRFKNRIKFGFDKGAHIKGRIIEYNKAGEPKVEISSSRIKILTQVPLPGDVAAKNFLAATTASLQLGLTRKHISSGADKIRNTAKRLNFKVFKSFTVLDDTYNSNPDSLRAAISVLSTYKKRKRKIAVLGDMFELGKESRKLHESLAEFILDNNIDEIYTLGKMMKYFTNKLRESGVKSEHFKSRESLKKRLNKIILLDSVILVKGSRGMRMEEFIPLLSARDN